MIKEYDIVALSEDRPEDGLKRGDIGTVVMVHDDGRAFEVEFLARNGDTIALLTLPAGAVRTVQPPEMRRQG
jgi:hypothetical protein